MLHKGLFFDSKLFKKTLRKFSTHCTKVFNILGRSSKIMSLHPKKNLCHITCQTNYMSGIFKRSGFLRNSLSNWLGWHMLQKCMFFEWNAFQRPLENFLRVVWQCLIYLKTCARSYLYARKKTTIIRHIDQKILTKNRFALGKIRFRPISISTTAVNHLLVLRYILISKSWKIFFKGQKCHFPIPKSFLISQRLLWKKIKSIRLIFLKISHWTRGGSNRPPLQVIM